MTFNHHQTLSVIKRELTGFGVTYGPADAGVYPAILILHGSEGGWAGWSHVQAMMLAAHGFLACPFPYSQDGNIWNAGSIHNVPLDQTVEAMNALRCLQLCNGKVGLLGTSRGGEHALLLTSLMSDEGGLVLPDAVAVHSPSDVVCGAFHGREWRDVGDVGWKAWDPADRAWTWRGSSEGILPTTLIEIDRYAGPIFLSHGTNDQVWDVEMTRRIEKRLLLKNRKPEVHYYEGENHQMSTDIENKHNQLLLNFFCKHLTEINHEA